MFSIFKKKPITSKESAWSVFQGKNNGKPMIIRFNESAKKFTRHSNYKYRIGVAIPLNASDQDGLPSPEENMELNTIEDALSVYLEKERRALQVMAITTSGMREFVFYSTVLLDAKEIVLAIQEKIPTHKLQSYVAEDSAWEFFSQFSEEVCP